MNPSSSTEAGIENLESLWLQHENVIQHLYIVQNKTLKEVKNAMESAHEFPALRSVHLSSIL